MKCRKCESANIRTVYDRSLDLLQRHCGNCGYSWSDPPADRQRELTTVEFLEFISSNSTPICGCRPQYVCGNVACPHRANVTCEARA